MITYYLIIILLAFLAGILTPITFLPDVSLPDVINAAFLSAGRALGMVYGAAPYTFVAVFAAIVIVVGVETKIFSYKTIRWLYQKIPGIT